jgi:hypothetical protein
LQAGSVVERVPVSVVDVKRQIVAQPLTQTEL